MEEDAPKKEPTFFEKYWWGIAVLAFLVVVAVGYIVYSRSTGAGAPSYPPGDWRNPLPRGTSGKGLWGHTEGYSP